MYRGFGFIFSELGCDTLSQAKDPMKAIDCLKGVEKKLVITQWMDHEKVLFAVHQFFGTTTNWWET
jgi:hypothetical protein